MEFNYYSFHHLHLFPSLMLFPLHCLFCPPQSLCKIAALFETIVCKKPKWIGSKGLTLFLCPLGFGSSVVYCHLVSAESEGRHPYSGLQSRGKSRQLRHSCRTCRPHLISLFLVLSAFHTSSCQVTMEFVQKYTVYLWFLNISDVAYKLRCIFIFFLNVFVWVMFSF